MHTLAFMKAVLVGTADRREERGAAFTEYVVLVGAVVAFVLLVGFTGLRDGLIVKINEIAALL